MKKRGSHGASHIDETWLIPYADLLTLLLALFVVLFALSTVDTQKYEAVMQAFYSEMTGSAPPSGSLGGISEEGFLPTPLPTIPSATPRPPQDGEQLGVSEAEKKMAELYESISGYIESNHLGTEINLRLHGEMLLLTLTSDVWFVSGSANISPGQRETALKLADLIKANQSPDLPLNIIITGHTDNIPIRTAQFKSNWYLSSTRAINFMEAMLENSDLDPRLFSARGYGEYEPIDTNDTDEGRRRNRRVEVLISYSNEMLMNSERFNDN